MAAPLADLRALRRRARGRLAQPRPQLRGRATARGGRTVHFPRSCLHCAEPACVTVCPTGASYKRAEDGIVLVDADLCIGCGLCAWACPYGARELDPVEHVMKKCTLCVDRIYNENLPEAERQPACVMACPTGARHFGDLGDPDSAVSRLVAERGGVDLHARAGLPADQQIPAAARAGQPGRSGERQRAGPGRRRARRPIGCSAGSTASSAPERACTQPTRSSCSPRSPAPATACWRCSAPCSLLGAAPGRPAAASSRSGLALAIGGPARLDLPSRPAGARLARLLAVAHVLAVARGRGGARGLRRGDCRWRCAAPRWPDVQAPTSGSSPPPRPLLAVATVWCTAMIYASLKPVPQWRHPTVPAAYLLLALATGPWCWRPCSGLAGRRPALTLPRCAGPGRGLGVKELYWRRVARPRCRTHAGDATGLGRGGQCPPARPAAHRIATICCTRWATGSARRHAHRLRQLRPAPRLRLAASAA